MAGGGMRRGRLSARGGSARILSEEGLEHAAQVARYDLPQPPSGFYVGV